MLFLKLEQEFDQQYQYGIVQSVKRGRDDRVHAIEVEYQNQNEKNKRMTTRGVREVVIHRVSESHPRSSSDNLIHCGVCLYLTLPQGCMQLGLHIDFLGKPDL